MIKKYIDIDNYKEFFKLIRWYKLYILSLAILPFGFVVEDNIARFLIIISFILFIVCIIMNFIESGKCGDQFSKKKYSYAKEALYLFLICTTYKFIFDIPEFIYRSFLIGKEHFSKEVFFYIMLWHLILFIIWLLTCTLHYTIKTQKKNYHNYHK